MKLLCLTIQYVAWPSGSTALSLIFSKVLPTSSKPAFAFSRQAAFARHASLSRTRMPLYASTTWFSAIITFPRMSLAVNKAPFSGLQKWWCTTAQGTSDQTLTGQDQSAWMLQGSPDTRYVDELCRHKFPTISNVCELSGTAFFAMAAKA